MGNGHAGMAAIYGSGLRLSVFKYLGGGSLGEHTYDAVTILENSGYVGIGTTTDPEARLEVNSGHLRLSDSSTHSDIEMNSATRPTIYPNGPNTPTNLDLQIRSKGDESVLQINNENSFSADGFSGNGLSGKGGSMD